MNSAKPVVAVVYEKKLNETRFRWCIEEASMTFYGVNTIDTRDLGINVQDCPSVIVISSEWINRGAEQLVRHLRFYAPQTHIILCDVQIEPLPKESLLRWLNVIDPNTFCTLEELVQCLCDWQASRPFVSAHSKQVITDVSNSKLPSWDKLTAAERGVLHLLADGQSGPEIAETLSISKRTVNNHKTNISLKLNVSGGPGSLVRFVGINRNKILRLLNG